MLHPKLLFAASFKFATNWLVNYLPIAGLRQTWYRLALGWTIEPEVEIEMGQYVQMAGIRTSGKKVQIGRGTRIQSNCLLYTTGGLQIGQNVTISDGVWLITYTHDINHPDFVTLPGQKITIGDGAWIGPRAVIQPNVTIGEGAIVEAGAVVSRNVLPHTRVSGAPARPKIA